MVAVFRHKNFSQKNPISQGSVETLFRWGGKRLLYVIAHFIQDVMRQVVSESAKFCRRYYKTFWLTFFLGQSVHISKWVSLLTACSHKARLVTMIHNIQIQYKILLMWNTDTNTVRENYITRNSSQDEIANVNFLYNEARPPYLAVRFGSLSYDDIVHAVQNTIDSCINSATDRRGHSAHLYRRPNPYLTLTLTLTLT